MSLKPLAEAVRQKGRGEDTVLIHMTPGEVQGLQALAMANGGSLTINPETGLPEASFLKSLLPTLIGVGLAATGIGAPMAGLIAGGIETARTGDLGKGLMAGLGAYGGAGLGTAAAAAAPAANVTAGGAATGLPAGAAGSVTPTLSNMGAGVSNMFSNPAARTAAMQSLKGTTLGAIGTPLAATAGPLTYMPPYQAPEEDEIVYEGPYLPTERKARFPTADRDSRDSSEFLYFEDTNPFPGFYPTNPMQPGDANYASGFAAQYGPQNMYQFAEGGDIRMAPEGYVAGQRPEFDYGFRPMDPTQVAPVEAIRQAGLAGLAGSPMLRKAGFANTDNDGSNYGGMGYNPSDMGYVPGVVAGVGRGMREVPPFMPGAITGRVAADAIMSGRGYAYNPLTRDYEQRDYMDGGSEGYSSMSGSDIGSTNVDSSLGFDDGDLGDTGREADDTFFRAGGGLNMDNGGFVVDAHTVSEIGNGSSDAGHEMLARIGGEPIKGPGDGVSDSIKANIGGVQEARVAKDESYLSREDVKALGGGDLKKGEKMLYQLMAKAHESRKQKGRGQATGLDKLINRMA